MRSVRLIQKVLLNWRASVRRPSHCSAQGSRTRSASLHSHNATWILITSKLLPPTSLPRELAPLEIRLRNNLPIILIGYLPIHVQKNELKNNFLLTILFYLAIFVFPLLMSIHPSTTSAIFLFSILIIISWDRIEWAAACWCCRLR